MKMCRPISPILTLKLVVMATSLERSKKGVRSTVKYLVYDKYLLYGENVLKIGPGDPEVICLNGLF